MKHVTRNLAATALLGMLCACGGQPEKKADAKPAGPDYSKMRSIKEVETVVPTELRIAYQNLFSCRYETALSQKKPAPELSPKYAVEVLEAVRRDPAEADRCMEALRSGESGSKV